MSGQDLQRRIGGGGGEMVRTVSETIYRVATSSCDPTDSSPSLSLSFFPSAELADGTRSNTKPNPYKGQLPPGVVPVLEDFLNEMAIPGFSLQLNNIPAMPGQP